MRSSIIRPTNLRALFVLLPAAALAQDLKLQGGPLDLNNAFISITSQATKDVFEPALPQIVKPSNWEVIEQTSAPKGERPAVTRRIQVREVIVEIDTRGIRLHFAPAAFNVFDASDIPDGELWVEFMGKQIPIATGAKSHNTPKRPSLTSCFTMKLTKDKKKADVDITGGLQAAVGASPQYNWSVKASCRVLGNELLPFGEIGPSFSGEASQQANADPDSLKAGITWRKLKAFSSSRGGFKFTGDLLSYEFERKPKQEPVLESGKPVDRGYLEKNSNLMWSGKAAYVTGWRPVNATLTFAGFEAGRSLSRTVKKDARSDSSQPVARLFFAADLYHHLFHGDKSAVILHGNHTLRLPFEPEPYKEAGVNGGSMFLTNKPRHYSLIEMTAPLTDGVAVNVQYKRGSLPPTFTFLDHQVTIGFNLLLKRQ